MDRKTFSIWSKIDHTKTDNCAIQLDSLAVLIKFYYGENMTF